MLCPECERGLGHVSEIIERYVPETGQFIFDVFSHPCLACHGTGGFCGQCLLNLFDCTCPDPELERPRKHTPGY